MNKSNSSVIFVLGQAQNIILSSLLKALGDDDVWLFTVYPVECSSKVRVVNIKPTKIGQLVVMLISVWRAIRALRNSGEINIYTPHLLNFLANKIYYRFRERAKLHYLFDGILNYRSVSASQAWALSYQKKQVYKSLAILHKYRFAHGEVVDVDLEGVEDLYVPSGVVVKSLKFKKPVVILPTSVSGFSADRRVLVLEPPLHGAALQTFQDKLLALITAEFSGYEVYIKYHPSMSRSKLDINRLTSARAGFQVLSEQSPAEYVYRDLCCEALISSNSSALLMVKVNYPDAKVYSIDCLGVDADPSIKEVEKIMKESGVVIL